MKGDHSKLSESDQRTKRYHNVFFLPEGGSGKDYETSEVRMESRQTALQISREIREAYRRFGYEPVDVPAGCTSLAERCQFVEEHIGK